MWIFYDNLIQEIVIILQLQLIRPLVRRKYKWKGSCAGMGFWQYDVDTHQGFIVVGKNRSRETLLKVIRERILLATRL